MDDLAVQVNAILEQQPHQLPHEIAHSLNTNELAVIRCYPPELVVVVPGALAQSLLETIADWHTTVTVIVHSGGSIFEIKAPLPAGKNARGYFNLLGEPGQLHGHLKLDLIDNIALVSKPFMGRDSHYFGFFNQAGECVFKVYLGRDKQGKLLPEQVSAFVALKHDLNN